MYVYMLMPYKSPYTVHQPAAWLTMFLSAHLQYSFEAFEQFVFFSLCIGQHLYTVYINLLFLWCFI